MDERELRQAVVRALRTVAPEVVEAELDSRAPLRDQVDLDSIDFLRFLVELHARLGVDVPEADSARLTSLDEIVRYLGARLGSPTSPAGAGPELRGGR